ncbi:MAG TPA: DUF4214 domain-containing protein [Gemmataceae bacterium]|nr:DUF4214 domain-containing protein [Gemmataceae bacterium]
MRFPFSRAIRSPRPRRFRPAIEWLEERSLMSTVWVTPIDSPVDATHFHSLAVAMPAAGTSGTVIVEPGASPDVGTVNVNLDSLTITGDTGFAPGALPRYDINVSAPGVTLTNLNLGKVTLATTSNNVTVSRSQVGSLTELGATSGVGHNLISYNFITGPVDLLGNSGGQSTADIVDHNRFASSAPIILELANSNNSIVKGNTIVGDSSSQIGIEVQSNSDGLLIVNNRVDLSGVGQPFALYLLNIGGAGGNILGARVLDNVLDAGPGGTGLYMNIFGTGAGFSAQVEGNEFAGNKIGIDVNGIPNSATGAGIVDLGGGSNAFGTSKGGNNFRGFNGLAGNFAIVLRNTDAGIAVVAHQNVFDAGINPNLVVKDSFNGGGTGSISVSNMLDADHAFVQNLFTKLLGRAGSSAELDQWVTQLPSKGRRGIARSITFSTESLTRMVDGFYATHLSRAATPTEITKWVKQIQLGTNINAVHASILGSAEFLTRISSDYVQAVFQQVLHRTATATEVAKWNGLMPTLGPKGVAAAIINSKEHRLQMVASYYADLLHRPPTPTEAAALSASPGTVLALQVSLLSGTEFYEHG